MTTTPYDDLLLWASEIQAGSLASLNRAAEWVAANVTDATTGRQLIHDLHCLGHIETDERKWAVTPPTWTRLADGGGNGVLIGARPRWLEKQLDDLDGSEFKPLRDLADYVTENTKIAQEGPATWYLTVGPGADVAGLSEVGIRVRDDLAGGLVSHLRSNGTPAVFREVRPGELAGRLVEGTQDGATGPEWESVSGDRRPGTYRYFRNHRLIYAEKIDATTWREREFRWAMWFPHESAHPQLLYVPTARHLYAVGAVRLPAEVERALVLRSGRLPRRGVAQEITHTDQPTARYENVTLAFAEAIAGILNKKVVMH
ncbi:hypothetical protein WBG06_26455 [Nocardioides sp. CCNWLW239]|uniref:hypothetical protein n=1 Tax=Nocardioides sp. CCNWLW239 TaxID=3128902 RepID=UPI00301A844E